MPVVFPQAVSITNDTLKKEIPIPSYLPKINGVLNLRYQYKDANSYVNSFDIRRAFLIMTGKIVEDISYRFMVDFANNPKILDFYLEWKPIKYLNVQVGQFRTPLSMENLYLPPALLTVDYALSVNNLVINGPAVDGKPTLNTGRDLGIGVYGNAITIGNHDLLEYNLSLFNGNMINTTDNNTTKDLSGSLYVQPVKGLHLGGSFYTGEFDVNKSTRSRYAFGTRYEDEKWHIRAEYLGGKTGIKESSGYYATVAYYVTPKIQPLVRYDVYQSDNTKSTTISTNYTAGFNYWMTSKSRLQLNYTYNTNADKTIKDNNYFVTQLMIVF